MFITTKVTMKMKLIKLAIFTCDELQKLICVAVIEYLKSISIHFIYKLQLQHTQLRTDNNNKQIGVIQKKYANDS